MLSESNWIAHRGYQRHYPENSALAIAAALAAGATWVEIDIQLSADHVPVVIHDDHTGRVSPTALKLSNSPWQQLSQLSNGEPNRFNTSFAHSRFVSLASLADIFSTYPNAQCMVELKTESINAFGADICLKQIKQAIAPFIERCVLISFDIETLAQANAAQLPRIAPVLRNWSQRDCVIKQLPHAELLFCNYRYISDDVIHSALPVAVYEVANFSQAQALYARGATLIETFAIGEMLDQTRRQLRS